MEVVVGVESEHTVLDLDIVKVTAERISVSPCAVALDPAGSLVVKVELVYLLLKVWITVSKTGEVEYVGVGLIAWFPSTSTTEYEALVRITRYSLRFRKSRGKEHDCNVSASMRKSLRKYIRSIES